MVAATRMRQSGSHRQSGIYREGGDTSCPVNGSIKSDLTPLKANALEGCPSSSFLGRIRDYSKPFAWYLVLTGLFGYFWRRDARLVVLQVVDHVPAVAVMTDLAGGVVLENDSPRFADTIVAQRP